MRKGFTLIEVVVALAIFSSAFVLIISLLPRLDRSTSRSRERTAHQFRLIEMLREKSKKPSAQLEDLPGNVDVTENVLESEEFQGLPLKKFKFTRYISSEEKETLEIIVTTKTR